MGALVAGASRKKVTVQYRKLDDVASAFGARTLQQAISACLKETRGSALLSDDPNVRQFGDDAYGTLVLNLYDDEKEYFFGEIVRFEPGADLPLLQIGTGVKAYNLTQAKAPDGHEPLRGVLYFMAIDNHLVLIEVDVSSARAERYLSWLLSEASLILKKGSHVILVAELTAASGSGLQLSKVDEVVFRPKPFAPDQLYGMAGSQIVDTVETATRGVAETNALEVLKAAGMDEADIQKFAAGGTELEVTLQIKFKGQRRKRMLSIEDTNRLLRNIPDDELTLKGPGGRQKNGKIEKLSYPANIETVGSLLKTSDVARALFEGYKSFVANGYIDG